MWPKKRCVGPWILVAFSFPNPASMFFLYLIPWLCDSNQIYLEI